MSLTGERRGATRDVVLFQYLQYDYLVVENESNCEPKCGGKVEEKKPIWVRVCQLLTDYA